MCSDDEDMRGNDNTEALRAVMFRKMKESAGDPCDLYNGRFGWFMWALEDRVELTKEFIYWMFQEIENEVQAAKNLGTFYWGILSSVPLILSEVKRYGVYDHTELVKLLRSKIYVMLGEVRRYELMGGFSGVLWAIEGFVSDLTGSRISKS